LALAASTRVVIERIKRGDPSFKGKYNQETFTILNLIVGAELEKGTGALCLLEMIKGNENLQQTPSELLGATFFQRYFHIFFCIQAFALSSFENQELVHGYIATI
jgi:hypothetical protein